MFLAGILNILLFPIETFGNNKMKNLRITLIAFAILLFASTSIFSQDITGLKVVENVYNRAVGEDMTANLTMRLINSSGRERVRKIKQFSRDFGEVEKKNYVLCFTR